MILSISFVFVPWNFDNDEHKWMMVHSPRASLFKDSMMGDAW